MDDLYGEVISVYTRADAIADGLLIDVSDIAKKHGIKFPTAVTCALAVSVGEEHIEDVIYRLRIAIIGCREKSGRIDFHFKDNQMYAVCGPGDDASPVITIMLIGED